MLVFNATLSMLQVKNITFSYQKNTTLSNITFELQKGDTLAIIGESGCGKSTLLKLIYGLYDLNSGTIHWNKKQVLGPKFHLIAGMPFMKYLAQDYDLMPYISVAENVGAFLSNMYSDKKKERVNELLEIVEMTEFASVKAKFLSGGQMQRVALARVLALEPEVLLLDEPFSNIDNFRKNSLRRKLFSYIHQKEITCIIATHDSKDILAFSKKTLVLHKGSQLTFQDTTHLYNHPEYKYIASLFEEANLLPAAFLNLKAPSSEFILVYPHQLEIVSFSKLQVVIKNTYFKGNGFLVEATFNNQSVFFDTLSNLIVGSKHFINLKDDSFLFINSV